MKTYFKEFPSPVGVLKLYASDDALIAVLWEKEKLNRKVLKGEIISAKKHKILDWAEKELKDYFSGKIRNFTVPLQPIGTPFQMKVWQELQRIEFGEVRSYAQQAKNIRKASAVRAVANANGRNPIPVIIPCHRVIGSNFSLTGFGGGLDKKKILLELEGHSIQGSSVMPMQQN